MCHFTRACNMTKYVATGMPSTKNAFDDLPRTSFATVGKLGKTALLKFYDKINTIG